jgi:drug/metabolite transporter (DMT)-like permease
MPNQIKSTKGILLIATGAICFSAKAIMIKLAYQEAPVDALTLLTLRFAISLPFFVLIAFLNHRKNPNNSIKQISWKDIAIICGLALLGYYIASLFDFMGLAYVTAGLERIILFSYPTFVVIFSYLFLKKKITLQIAQALIITYLGLLVIVYNNDIFSTENSIKGAIYIFISAITYAIYLVFGSKYIQKYGSVNFNSLAMMISCLYVIAHYLILGNGSLFSYSWTIYAYGFALAIISTVIPTFLVMEGIRILGANKGAIVATVGPVSTIFLGWLILNEAFTLQEFLGSVLVIIGVFLTSHQKKEIEHVNPETNR